jgi:CBS domain-containing protein
MTDPIAKLLEHKGCVVETTTSMASVAQAVEKMNARRIGSLVVVDRGQVVGIFTERDVLVRVVAVAMDPLVTPVRDVMTPDPITVRPETTMMAAMSIISDRRCRHLPVVGDHGLVGLISAGDLTGYLVRAQQRTIYDLEDFIRAA